MFSRDLSSLRTARTKLHRSVLEAPLWKMLCSGWNSSSVVIDNYCVSGQKLEVGSETRCSGRRIKRLQILSMYETDLSETNRLLLLLFLLLAKSKKTTSFFFPELHVQTSTMPSNSIHTPIWYCHKFYWILSWVYVAEQWTVVYSAEVVRMMMMIYKQI